MKKFLLLFCALTLTLALSGTGHATITNTQVDVGMMVQYGSFLTPDVSQAVSDPVSASVNLTGPVTGATVHSSLTLSSLTAQSATLTFNMGWSGSDYQDSGYMGQSSYSSNNATIVYSAPGSANVLVTWNFGFTGPNPFGVQSPAVHDTYGTSAGIDNDLGTAGASHNGQKLLTFSGNDTFTISFNPNIWGIDSANNGALVGTVSLNFQPVPIPASILLFGPGLVGLAAIRRRFKK